MNSGGSAAQKLDSGVVHELGPLVRRIVAPNGGFMTGPGTNTYLVGDREVALIDPGPDDDLHIDAIVNEVGDRLRWILCTHTHPDHSPGAARLAQLTGAEVLAHSSRDGLEVDRTIDDGSTLVADEFELEVIATPGHASNHLCFMLTERQTLFTGDHIVNGSTSVVLPPEGNMADYMDSLVRVKHARPEQIAPGHGGLIEEPDVAVDHYIVHRQMREQQILEVLNATGGTYVDEIVTRLYSDVPEVLHPFARQSVFAHLLKLVADGVVNGAAIDQRWALR